MSGPVITNILLCAFHHRHGPCVEFCHPPLPELTAKSTAASRKLDSSNSDGLFRIPLPQEWSDLPFFCLPDGAHLSEEEFTYFHLGPVKEWEEFKWTTFGMACCRQINASVCFRLLGCCGRTVLIWSRFLAAFIIGTGQQDSRCHTEYWWEILLS